MKFFGGPLRHSVKSVTESVPTESSPQEPVLEQTIATPFAPIGRKGIQLPSRGLKTPFKRIRFEEPKSDS